MGIDNRDISPAPTTHHPEYSEHMEEQLSKEAGEEAGFDSTNGDIWVVDVSDDKKKGESVNWVFKPFRGDKVLEAALPSIWASNNGKMEIAKVSKNGEDVEY